MEKGYYEETLHLHACMRDVILKTLGYMRQCMILTELLGLMFLFGAQGHDHSIL